MSASSYSIQKEMSAFPFWEALTVPEREKMLSCAQIRSFERDALIYSKDQECLGLIYVITGNVRTFLLSGEGRE